MRRSLRFAGHRMAYLIQAIFAARGMTTWLSPEGPDGGVDVLVGSGPLGMDASRIGKLAGEGEIAVEIEPGDIGRRGQRIHFHSAHRGEVFFPGAALRGFCFRFQFVQMREVFAGISAISAIWQRCSPAIDSR